MLICVYVYVRVCVCDCVRACGCAGVRACGRASVCVFCFINLTIFVLLLFSQRQLRRQHIHNENMLRSPRGGKLHRGKSSVRFRQRGRPGLQGFVGG